MPTYFPQLNSAGMIVQRPYISEQLALTSMSDHPLGYQHSRSNRTNPISRWQLAYSSLTDAEASALETFFDSMGGRYGEFTFLDPGGNLVQYSDDFTHASWNKASGVTVGAATTDPFGGNRATTLTGTTSNGGFYTELFAAGNAPAGFVICGSFWIRSATARPIFYRLTTNVATTFAQNTVNLAAGVWTRVSVTGTVPSTPNNVVFIIGGNLSIPTGAAFDFFGIRCAPMAGPGGYVRSPTNYGVHAKCRFDSDVLALRYVGPNQHAASIPIIEYK